MRISISSTISFFNSKGANLRQDLIRLSGGFTLYSYVHDPNAWLDILGLSTSSDAVELRANMKEAGIPEPEYRNSAHHIVLSNSTNDKATELRTHMNSLGIETNSAANGVYLPTSSAVKEASGTDALAHSRVLTHAYINNIYNRLTNINNKDEFEAELQNIAGELQDGTCVI